MRKRPNERQVLDDKDRSILSLVQRDGKLPQAEIARQVGLSAAAVNERLRKLEQAGVIRRYGAVIDPRSVGSTIAAFIEVFIEHPRHEAGFIEKMQKLEQVQECHHITGEFSMLLKVRVDDIEGLQSLLVREINGLPGVRQTRTVIVLSTIKEDGFVPTGARGEKP
jgi:Lrp/AsnC family leucine-responsive transcriptional regulator